MSERRLEDDIEEITVRIGALEVAIRGRALSTVQVEDSGYSVVSAPSASASAQPRAEHPLLELSSAGDLAAYPLPELSDLVRQLRARHSTWTPAARIARAFRAGLTAQQKLAGLQTHVQSSPSVPFRNSLYIVLRCPQFPLGFWTSDYEVYRGAVFGPGHIFYDDTISHAFASQAEGEAYLRGAGRQWPESR